MRMLRKYFLNGLLFLAPIAATLYVFWLLFKKVDDLFKFDIPGIGFLLTVGIVTLVGFLASNFLSRGAGKLVDSLFTKLPLVKMIYNSVKDLTNAFVGDKKSFDRPVAVILMPGSNVQALGFITKDDLSNLGFPGKAAVYLPHSYNFSGCLVVVPKEQITALNIDSGELMAFVVSGGVSSKSSDKD